MSASRYSAERKPGQGQINKVVSIFDVPISLLNKE